MDKKQKQIEEITSKICFNCICLPSCSKVCVTYFNKVNKVLDLKLSRTNWLKSSKHVCDEASLFLAQCYDAREEKNEHNI